MSTILCQKATRRTGHFDLHAVENLVLLCHDHHGIAAESKTNGSRIKNLAEKIAAIRGRRTRCKEMLTELDRTGADQISLTDPDSRAMAGLLIFAEN